VKTLIKGKKEKDNVLTNLELINLKNVTLLQFKEIRRKTTKAKKKVNGGQKGVSKEFATPKNTIGDGIGTKKEFGSSWCQKKTKGL